jgi:hypothetical protein
MKKNILFIFVAFLIVNIVGCDVMKNDTALSIDENYIQTDEIVLDNVANMVTVSTEDELKYKEYNGKVAVIINDVSIANPYFITVNDEGEYVAEMLSELSLELKKNDMVVVIDEKEQCRIIIPYGDIPRIRGYVDSGNLSYDSLLFSSSNQCVVRNCATYDGEGTKLDMISATAEILGRKNGKTLIQPLGAGMEKVWVNDEDVRYDFEKILIDLKR